ncbi:MAG: DUF4159 domain-containing protein [Flavobacteriales bacterium]|nr:DUF4159 domain-containing protein [Flavobacteriales bacterium]NCG28876.1 DUF4159 domain-containing protein [Bacteroidota bacterium]MBT3964014.1 DUF4159 domain-containing protein [Flavobacteriales bacterium]MBT4704522.1 DUF4159 domain-containing protein [Flavobacteriales bacterium]MBT4931277.1 DUF4159 domain-containing protein [Flavobacteriales bacterium]
MKPFLLLLILSITSPSFGQGSFKLALLKYNGGGDWYANLETSLPNLIEFTNSNLQTSIHREQAIIDLGDKALFNYPFAHLTGHGNIIISPSEAENLRNYMIAGGFLHIDDNYGMDPFIRPELEKIFPELELIELPPSHPIFHQAFEFSDGLPKIHEHDEKRPQALALYYEGRMVCLYTFESDLGDGWEDPRIHNDTEENHLNALKMGANILQFVFLNNEPTG